MKEFVVGSPYTTETELDDEDEFLIVACDGVSHLPLYFSDNSSGTYARTRTQSTSCAPSRTHRRHPSVCLTTRSATTRPTTSASWSSALAQSNNDDSTTMMTRRGRKSPLGCFTACRLCRRVHYELVTVLPRLI